MPPRTFDYDRARALVAEVGIAEASRRLGVRQSTMQAAKNRLGWPVPAGAHQGPTRTFDYDRAKPLVAEVGIAEAARRLGVERHSVGYAARRYGWPQAAAPVVKRPGRRETPFDFERGRALAAEHGLGVAARELRVGLKRVRQAALEQGWIVRHARRLLNHERAKALVAEVGIAEAARRLDVDISTVSRAAKKGGWPRKLVPHPGRKGIDPDEARAMVAVLGTEATAAALNVTTGTIYKVTAGCPKHRPPKYRVDHELAATLVKLVGRTGASRFLGVPVYAVQKATKGVRPVARWRVGLDVPTVQAAVERVGVAEAAKWLALSPAAVAAAAARLGWGEPCRG